MKVIEVREVKDIFKDQKIGLDIEEVAELEEVEEILLDIGIIVQDQLEFLIVELVLI